MPKHAHAARTQIVYIPPQHRSRGRLARAYHRGRGAVARRIGRPTKKGAVVGTSLMLGAAAIGYAQGKGMLNRIPTIGGSRSLTLAVLGYAMTRMSTNKTIRLAGNAALIAGIFNWSRVQGGGVEGLDTDGVDTEGDAEGDAEGDEY